MPRLVNYTKEYCEVKLFEKFGDKFTYDFSLFNNTRTGIIIVNCPNHKNFEKQLNTLLLKNNKHGCNKCHWDNFVTCRTKDWDNFKNKATAIHNGYYSYPPQTNYMNRESIISIICPTHGIFNKRAQKHLSGQGCIDCVYENLINSGKLPGGYCEQVFIDNPSLKNVNAILYYIEINDGRLYKIGITTTSTSDRIKSLKCKSNGYIKSASVLHEEHHTLYECFIKEQHILKLCDFARAPRKWSTELFSENILQYI